MSAVLSNGIDLNEFDKGKPYEDSLFASFKAISTPMRNDAASITFWYFSSMVKSQTN